MNLTINRLATATWNRLGMNRTQIALEGEFKNHTPEILHEAEGISLTPDAAVPAAEENELNPLTADAPAFLVKTNPDDKMKEPLVLCWNVPENGQSAARLALHAAKNSAMQVIVLLKSAGKGDTLALQTEITAEEGANVQLYTAQMMGKESVCMNIVTGVCEKDAVVGLTKLELGAGKLYAGATIDLKGAESVFRTDIGYHAGENQLLDMNYNALHYGKNTESIMEISGTLEENSKKIFRGTIDFKAGCSGAKGNEHENVLLMGEKMVNKTIPLILCAEEDVEGNHGASIGKLDEKVLFYLSSRGFSEQDARRMMAHSRIESVCARFPDENIRGMIREFEEQRGLADEAEL